MPVEQGGAATPAACRGRRCNCTHVQTTYSRHTANDPYLVKGPLAHVAHPHGPGPKGQRNAKPRARHQTKTSLTLDTGGSRTRARALKTVELYPMTNLVDCVTCTDTAYTLLRGRRLYCHGRTAVVKNSEYQNRSGQAGTPSNHHHLLAGYTMSKCRKARKHLSLSFGIGGVCRYQQ